MKTNIIICVCMICAIYAAVTVSRGIEKAKWDAAWACKLEEMK